MTIKFQSKIFDVEENPVVMGILNITPDSFSDGGNFLESSSAIEHGLKLLEDGADWLDLGAESTRPGSDPVGEKEELERLIPVIEGILKHQPDAILSVDTYKAKVAEETVHAGCKIVNDISAGSFDPKMIPIVASLKVPYIMMHILGNPKTMQQNPNYKNVVDEVFHFLANKKTIAGLSGVEQIMIDPGFGFGKTLEHNYQLLKGLSKFQELKNPIVIGISRKSMIGSLINKIPSQRILASKVAETIAYLNGGRIFRVHDVKETREMLQVLKYYKNV